jgi:hypothetical protein
MCQFHIPFSGDAESLLRRAKQEIVTAGGEFAGTAASGDFSVKSPLGSIRGSYQVEGQQILLVITKKPFLLSCSKIGKELNAVMR